MKSILDALDTHATLAPDRLAYRFLQGTAVPPVEISYGELRQRSLAVAQGLRARMAPGERALIMLPSGLEFVEALLGCMYARVIAVPLYPPRPNQNFNRLVSVVANAAPTLAITQALQLRSLKERCEADLPAGPMRWESIEALREHAGQADALPRPHGDDVAFIQYTSGSTAAPKGVVLSHGNIVHNQARIERAFGHEPSHHVMGWLPVFHDMGLIGNVLQPLYLGIGCTLMSHLQFLQKPISWLQAISDHRATTSGGPNFAYQLCADKVTAEQKAGLDLRHWRLAFCGAEVVRSDTLDQFSRAFAECGFDSRSFYPCYGLAEATLFVSGAATRRGPVEASFDPDALSDGRAVLSPPDAAARTLVGCGIASGHELRIVDPDSLAERPAGEVGEIWIRSASVALGYWQNDTLTRDAFGARIAGDPQAGRHLRTGDLGFLDDDGELFVTGRLKDLIIVRGSNHVPTDIELTVERSHRASRPGGCAAFAVDVAGQERLVVAQEIERTARDFDPAGTHDLVLEQVTRHHGIRVHDLVFLRQGTLPRTSSGKIQRHLCAKSYLAGTLASSTWKPRPGGLARDTASNPEDPGPDRHP